MTGAQGPGSAGRARWIALAGGFLVLVAVIAVQHFAGGGPSPSTGATAPSSTSERPTPSSPSFARPVTTPAPRTSRSTSHTTAVSRIPTASGIIPHRGVATPRAEAPRITSVRPHLLPGAAGWDIVGYGAFGLVRFRPNTGAVVVTAVPSTPGGNASLLFVATPDRTFIRPTSSGTGYLARHGHLPQRLPGALAGATQAFPGPDPSHLWITDSAEPVAGTAVRSDTLLLVDDRGQPTGTTVTIPAALGSGTYSYRPDQAGGVLVYGVGGTYDARADGLRLVTHGLLLAAGPSRYVVYECTDTARCHVRVIDRATGRRTTLAATRIGPTNLIGGGLVSPDGRVAAVIEGTVTGSNTVTSHLHLIDLRSGADRTVDLRVNDDNDAWQVLAFSPDNRYLLIATASGQIAALDRHTGRVVRLPPPIPPVQVLAIAPAN